MSRKLRTILIIAGIIIAILVIVPFLIPVNQFKPTIEAKASAALGRKVEVGNLSLSLLSGSLGAENLVIGEDPKFGQTPFITAKKVNVGVEMMPLIFSRTVNVTSVSIKNPQVTLLHNQSGKWNYSSIGGSAAKASDNASGGGLAIQKVTLDDGTIIVGFAGSSKRSTYEHVSVTASDISSKSKFPFTVSADLPGGGKFKLDGNAGPINETDADLTPVDAKITASSLNLASTGFIEPSTGLGGLLDLDATLNSANGEADTKGSAKLTKALLISGGAPSTVPLLLDFHTKYNLEKQSGVFDPSPLKLGNAVGQVSGTFNNSGEATVVNMKVNGQNMPAHDVEAFLPALGVHMPEGATIQGGTMNANLNMTGPTVGLVTSGNVGAFSFKLVGFDLGSKMSAVSALTGLKTGKDLDVEKVTTNLRMTRDGIKVDNFVAVIPALGNLNGGGTIDGKNNLDFKMVASLKSGVLAVAGSPVSAVSGALGQLTGGGVGGGSGCKNGVTVPFMIKGTTANPQFVPDVGGIAGGMLKSQLGCAGSTVTGAGGRVPNPVDAVTGLGGLFKKPKP